ncbi:MAG: polyphosphate polymerase domain-containing protein [Oscillospiraceae bacterium]|jgi:SPX domain protein involved in polyphosphate accumulation|nr:polyphosphate polymerase domain-containing protein [Oscillospiraceae bacterium]
MDKYKNEFLRVEKKYILSQAECEAVLDALSTHMTEEQYGEYTISNIYYDTPDFRLIRASIEKPLYKEKLRLRAYGTVTESSEAFIEIKKKFKGVVYKRRAELPLENARAFLNGKNRQPSSEQVLRETDWMLNLYGLAPAAAISYDRAAFVGKDDPEFRLTIDKNLKGRTTSLDLITGAVGDEIISPDKRVMEIKTAGGMPLWMCRLLTDLSLYPTSFSKYGEYYKSYIINSEIPYLIQKEMVKSA